MNHHLLLKQFEHLNHQNPDTFESRDLDMLIKAVRVCPQSGVLMFPWGSVIWRSGNITFIGSGDHVSSKEGCLSFLTTDTITNIGAHRSSMSPNPECCKNWTRFELASHNGIYSFYLDVIIRKSCLWRFYGNSTSFASLWCFLVFLGMRQCDSSLSISIWPSSLGPKFGKSLKILLLVYLFYI